MASFRIASLHSGRRSPHGAVDPVADDLHPAVAEAGLLGDDLREVAFVVEFDAQFADVALRAGDVAAGADDPGQFLVVVDEPGVDGRARVAQQQGPCVAFGLGLRDGARSVLMAPAVPDADVTVGVDQPRHDPPCAAERFGSGHRLERHQAVAHPEVAHLTVGQNHTA